MCLAWLVRRRRTFTDQHGACYKLVKYKRGLRSVRSLRGISRSGRRLGLGSQSQMLILSLITCGKVPFSPVPARLAEIPEIKPLSWPSRARGMDPFLLREAVGMGTGSGMEIQPLQGPGLWACLESGVGWWGKRGTSESDLWPLTCVIVAMSGQSSEPQCLSQ